MLLGGMNCRSTFIPPNARWNAGSEAQIEFSCEEAMLGFPWRLEQNPKLNILLMEEILGRLIWRISEYPIIYKVLIHSRWCRISSINRRSMVVLPLDLRDICLHLSYQKINQTYIDVPYMDAS